MLILWWLQQWLFNYHQVNDGDSKCDSDSKTQDRKFYSLGRTRYHEHDKNTLPASEFHSNTIHRSGTKDLN